MQKATKFQELSELGSWLPGSKLPQLTKESDASSWISSASWMPESISKWFFGVRHRNAVTMHKMSFKKLSMR